MNERIRELALQAGHPGFPRGEIELQKFAHLLVQECADYVQFYYKDHACEVIAHDMKTHFGIES